LIIRHNFAGGRFDFAQSKSAHHLLLGEKPVEGFDRGELVVLDIEDGVELGDVENVVDFLLKFSSFSSPPPLRTVVKLPTSSPTPVLSM